MPYPAKVIGERQTFNITNIFESSDNQRLVSFRCDYLLPTSVSKFFEKVSCFGEGSFKLVGNAWELQKTKLMNEKGQKEQTLNPSKAIDVSAIKACKDIILKSATKEFRGPRISPVINGVTTLQWEWIDKKGGICDHKCIYFRNTEGYLSEVGISC